ncbi:MAG: glycosyl hydrolase [Cyclobacteriaceae bacterium]|nr:glycosyl hydrolase [Cyclobacteriaceae bacterium]
MKNLVVFTFFLLTSVAYSQNLDSLFKTMKYRSIGPFRGGRSNSASGVIGDPFTYYMGTTGGGLWKTNDAGNTWNNISDGYFKTGSVGAVAVSESDPNIIYVGMGEHAPRGVMTSYGDGVYKSYDAGKTWSHMGLEKTMQISRIAIHPKNPDIVLVASQGAIHGATQDRGIYKSIDGGTTWKKVLYVNDMTGCSELSMDMSNPQVIYAAMWHHQRLPWKVISGGPGSGLYKSVDGGDSWVRMEKDLPKEMGKMAIAVSRANPEKVYALIESDWEKALGGLYVSSDAGKSWTHVSEDHRLIQRSWYYIEVFPDPNDENTVYVMNASALRSIDGGKSWETLGGTHGDYHDLWINPNNSKNMVIVNDGGAAISFNYAETFSTQYNMPTAQFYRISLDNNFPYRIYAGQQDNTTVRIQSMAFGRNDISEEHWTYSAGGESAFLAFDPNDPTYVMGGSYLGTIEVLNTKVASGTNVMAAPIQYLGRDASDMKYRFNWNAPIIWSKHEPGTFYHGSQLLLRTRDMGVTWEEASPDLTRNEKAKQGKMGGPYTNEAVGAENYGTLAYVIESPSEKGVIWTGSDDGYVQVTRDNGKTWSNVTPKGLAECLVNSIEVSPHDPATAYIATTRYKFNDLTPGLYKTTDYGKTWVNIGKGIPYGAYTRVIREDTSRKGLLYAGTETGMYISYNGGTSWSRFQLNLPVTPITDLMLKGDDLVVATMGRSFWILDDLGLIRQYKEGASAFTFYKPDDAMHGSWRSPLTGNSAEFDGTNPLYGVNPANGVVMYYNLPKLPDSVHLTLELRDGSGKLIRTLTSKKDEAYQRYYGAPPADPVLPKAKGINRFVWDTRYPSITGAPTAYIEGSYRGHKAIPGNYTATLKYPGAAEQKVDFKILNNPMYQNTADQFREWNDFMTTVEQSVSNMHQKVNQIKSMRDQLKDVLKEMSDEAKFVSLKKEGEELVKKMTAWDEDMVQRRSKAYDDVENFPNKFTANYLFVINHADSDIPMVTKPDKDRVAELERQWEPLNTRAKTIIETDVPAYTKKLWDAGIGAVWVSDK